ncbi:response regulator [Chelativorans sp. Marseille-P2723]|uniref:response regulator n=1 Tax=Chelativorans sp. Marseille-P2723 TaxID=2709133 RepID=UPI00156E154E|nr:response regulator [Chelativorans sp. Marseille-P2723]
MTISVPSRKFEGIRVFIVEDEALVAMNLEMMLEDLGCEVVGPAMRYDTAEEMVSNGVHADIAILDVNLGGREVFPLAARLAKDGIPLIFSTGYGAAVLPEQWQRRPLLQKPYTVGDVASRLSLALSIEG